MRQDSFNQTAYRILCLLLWLKERPLTLDAINRNFDADPTTQKALSQDTIGLYLNTLKALGCEIKRPTASNDYHYQLTYHPFSYVITPQTFEFLKDLRQAVDGQVSLWQYFHFNVWLHKVFSFSANRDRQDLIEQFFGDAFYLDIHKIEDQLKTFEDFIEKQQLVKLTYQSPLKTSREINLLAHRLFYKRGVFYVLGFTPEHEKAVMLRLERITGVSIIKDTTTLKALLHKQQEQHVYLVRLLNCCSTNYETFNSEDQIVEDPESKEHLIVRIHTDNEFLMQQHLLSLGYPFQILYPENYRKQLIAELKAIKAVYS